MSRLSIFIILIYKNAKILFILHLKGFYFKCYYIEINKTISGAMSWVMRLQNEPHSAHMQDYSNSDLSTLFLPSFGGRQFDEQVNFEKL